jgi:acyl dehydratase
MIENSAAKDENPIGTANDSPGSVENPYAVGERFERRAGFDAASIRQFAAMCGDRNPLHHDSAAAAAGPFGRLIASGPHVVSLMMGLDATFFSSRFEALGLEFDFRFVKAIPEGAELTLEWTITGCEWKPSLAGFIVTVVGRAVDAAGNVFTTAHGANLIRMTAREVT